MARPLTINYTIPIGSYLRFGYRDFGSSDPFFIYPVNPFYNQSPFTIQIDSDNMQEVEMRTVCGSCPDGNISNPIYVTEELQNP